MQIGRRYSVGFDSEWDVAGVRDMVRAAGRVVLVAHTNADGDAVGSVTGMYAVIHAVARWRNRAITLTPMLPDGVPADLTWLPNTGCILSGRNDAARCRESIEQADLIIGLDISGPSRTGCLERHLRAATAKKILVDHHECPEREAYDVVVSEPRVSSACELVYWLSMAAFGSEAFTTDAATSLYAGICTDTGTFSFSNDRQSVYLAAAELLQYGIDPMRINRNIKNIFSVARMRFFGYAIAHRLEIYDEQQVALMVLSAKDMADAGMASSELTGLINEVMKLKDTDCGILVREEMSEERPGEMKIRLSLRSKERYDVNLLAREMFPGGGGHKRAAGATSTVSLEETVEIVKRKLKLK